MDERVVFELLWKRGFAGGRDRARKVAVRADASTKTVLYMEEAASASFDECLRAHVATPFARGQLRIAGACVLRGYQGDQPVQAPVTIPRLLTMRLACKLIHARVMTSQHKRLDQHVREEQATRPGIRSLRGHAVPGPCAERNHQQSDH